ncbi:MAG: serine/threonine-protein kinase [Planctomycetota bacterium]
MSTSIHQDDPSRVQSNPFDELSAEDQETLSEILESYLADMERGVPVSPETLLQQHPRFRNVLRWYLESLSFLTLASEQLGTTAPPATQRQELGDFEIVREIGRGGMGIVYEASQKSLGRKVALKVLPFAAVLDQKQIARFRNEAQAAAQLHHDHIVPVYSVGTDRGVHYYSMQYIEGQSLDRAISQLQACEDHASDAIADVSTEKRVSFSTNRSVRTRDHIRSVVELVIQAAEALHHAHEFGVVHRDVKPSNLLIDRVGKLWVTDFGLARCQSSVTITMTGDLLGTLRYMSPEAAAGSGHLVDQLSDVYSLGVTLYELLTLTPPHDQTDRSRLLEAIQDKDPPPPRSHNGAIDLDLETIVLKAISKTRDQRYCSCQAFADDLRRFLDGQPPLAKRPTLIDRAAKWATRRKRLVASTLAGLLASTLIAFATVTLLLAERRKTDVALAEAESNFAQAQINLGKAIEVVDRFGLRLSNELSTIPGAESIRRRMLQQTLGDFQQFAEQMRDDGAMRRAMALCQAQIASMHRQLGQFDDATDSYRDAIDLYDELESDSADVVDRLTAIRHEKAVCHNNLGELLFQRGDIDAATTSYERGLALVRKLVADAPDETHRHLLSATLVNYGNLARARDERSRARAMYREAVELQRRLCDDHSNDTRYRRELAVSYAQLAFLWSADDLNEADRLNQLAIELHQALVDAEPHNLLAISELATCYNHRGGILSGSGRMEDAQAAHCRGLELQQQLVLRAPSVVRFQEQLAVGYNNLGQMLIVGDASLIEEAIEQFDKAREALSSLVETSPESPHYKAQLGGVLSNIAPLLEENDPERAERLYREAVRYQQQAVERSPEILDFRLWLSSSYVKFGRFLRSRGESDAAGTLVKWRRELWDKDAERLYRVAVEFAETVSIATDQEQKQKWSEYAAETWRRAIQLGLPDAGKKRADPAFAILRNNPELNFAPAP